MAATGNMDLVTRGSTTQLMWTTGFNIDERKSCLGNKHEKNNFAIAETNSCREQIGKRSVNSEPCIRKLNGSVLGLHGLLEVPRLGSIMNRSGSIMNRSGSIMNRSGRIMGISQRKENASMKQDEYVDGTKSLLEPAQIHFPLKQFQSTSV